MSWVLLAGAAYNWFGASKLLRELFVRQRVASDPPDYEMAKLYFFGSATAYGAIYLYLFFDPRYIIPLLVVGASLKTWCFVYSSVLRTLGRMGNGDFVLFGLGNLAFAILFWIYIWSV